MLVPSWTNLCFQILSGKITLEDLKDAQYSFGCSREHIIRDDGLIPHESTWSNTKLELYYRSDDTHVVDISLVDEELRPKVLELLAVLKEADKEGRIRYKTRYWDEVNKLGDDDLVLGDTICTVKEFKKF